MHPIKSARKFDNAFYEPRVTITIKYERNKTEVVKYMAFADMSQNEDDFSPPGELGTRRENTLTK